MFSVTDAGAWRHLDFDLVLGIRQILERGGNNHA